MDGETLTAAAQCNAMLTVLERGAMSVGCVGRIRRGTSLVLLGGTRKGSSTARISLTRNYLPMCNGLTLIFASTSMQH